MIGRLERMGNTWFVKRTDTQFPDWIRLVIERGQGSPLRERAMVEAELLLPASRGIGFAARIKKILGYEDDPDLAWKTILCRYGIPQEFPPEVIREAEDAAEQRHDFDPEKRMDFRSWNIFTIDNQDAYDYDDAVSVRELASGNFFLGVHIADVTHFVKEGGALDREACRRGNSNYFPNHVVPMLPPVLSHRWCSLMPDQDRLVFSVLMEIDREGEIRKKNFVRGVIRSRARLTYPLVDSILRNPEDASLGALRSWEPTLRVMEKLCRILAARRTARGCIDLDLPEAVIAFGEDGGVKDISRTSKSPAHQIIEEFMIAANETVAVHLAKKRKFAMFRIHEDPDPLRVGEFLQLARTFRLDVPKSPYHLQPVDFQKMNDQIRSGKSGGYLSARMLRVFAQARYSEAGKSHFGLASPCYTHFTSPIRRYADISVHRLLTQSLTGKTTGRTGTEDSEEGLRSLAEKLSFRERLSDGAEREMTDHYRALYMRDRLGEEFGGRVSGVERFGLFVELESPFVEGFLPARYLAAEGLEYDPREFSYRSKYLRQRIRLGDGVRIRVDTVDMDSRRITFSLIHQSLPTKERRKAHVRK